SEINKKIISIVKLTGIKYIYGEDFWRMQLLNSIDAEVHSSELTDSYDKFVIPRTWLSRPSWYCINGEVLYYTKDGKADKIIESELKSKNGKILYNGAEGKIWLGPVIWSKPKWCN
ncbi:hypothetical protein FOX03_23470, partial [Salmonella enterica]|nr:hypothetical protein [Salmonella enterica]ECV5993592.1 hypothetical protein [Salmonella enterica subsp. enterica serovar Tennessee]EGD3336807.1 hypothetical protein [Salmonella enterica subsp. enterica serovar Rissen]EBC7507597.1 hypothetical protein [Salmonella enterica]ECH3347563.1 hypothetical protein [Salmonella enterica]